MRALGLILAFVFLGLPGGAFAQSLETLVSTEPFTVTTAPQYPAPGSSVRVTLLSAQIDLAAARLAVSVNGSAFYNGTVRALDIPVGKAGALTTIRLTLTANGATYAKTVAIRPQDLVLIAEPRATAPPLYPGKPREPVGGSVRLVALASFRTAAGAPVDASALAYTWNVDGVRQANASGIGRNTFIAASPPEYRAKTVSVVAASQDGALAAEASHTLSPIQPTVRIYQNDPLLGVRFDRALSGAYDIQSAEAPLYAALYSFPLLASAATVAWYLNGAPAENGPLITLRPTGEGRGSASLSLVAAVGDIVRATGALDLTFGAGSRSGFFGL